MLKFVVRHIDNNERKHVTAATDTNSKFSSNGLYWGPAYNSNERVY